MEYKDLFNVLESEDKKIKAIMDIHNCSYSHARLILGGMKYDLRRTETANRKSN